eukprot:1158267-Pelagomonas_calceolata.AAC.5
MLSDASCLLAKIVNHNNRCTTVVHLEACVKPALTAPEAVKALRRGASRRNLSIDRPRCLRFKALGCLRRLRWGAGQWVGSSACQCGAGKGIARVHDFSPAQGVPHPQHACTPCMLQRLKTGCIAPRRHPHARTLFISLTQALQDTKPNLCVKFGTIPVTPEAPTASKTRFHVQYQGKFGTHTHK